MTRLERWLLQAPGLRTALIFATEGTVPHQTTVRLVNDEKVVAECTAILGATALGRALDKAEGQS